LFDPFFVSVYCVDMLTEFVGLQLNREELLEIHKALLAQALVQDTLRREKGEEENHEHALLQKIEGLLGENEESLHTIDEESEEEMWEYAWYAFTDEWAWHRSLQALEAQMGKRFTTLAEAEKERLIEAEYRKNFDTYVAEVDMRDGQMKKKTKKVQKKQG